MQGARNTIPRKKPWTADLSLDTRKINIKNVYLLNLMVYLG